LGPPALHFEELKQATLSEFHDCVGIIHYNVIFLFMLSFLPFNHDELWKVYKATFKDELPSLKNKIWDLP
jgi:uncharacterized membrane protein